MNILITSLNSYIGTNIYDILVNDGHNVSYISLRNRDYINEINDKVDVVIHLAGLVHKNEKNYTQEDYDAINFNLTKELYNICNKVNVKKFIFFSTIAVYGLNGSLINECIIDKNTPTNPITFYGKSKLKAEHFLLNNYDKTNVTVVRIPMVIGTGNYNTLIKIAKLIKIMPSCSNKRSIITTTKIGEDILKIINNDINGIVHLQENKLYSTKDIIEIELKDKKVIYLKSLYFFVKKINIKKFRSSFGNLTIDKSITL